MAYKALHYKLLCPLLGIIDNTLKKVAASDYTVWSVNLNFHPPVYGQ